ncbi:hypothetical protein CDAR_119851 [Caerostris darwini]|uniref:Uncharacterized protein n=1 Tax=Caerostris darwini TaxID=1538125 RepID=A0AAV4UZ59_9ARAC|nr:hypothetical protein CDAR_119851 [Caerostris darwini]
MRNLTAFLEKIEEAQVSLLLKIQSFSEDKLKEYFYHNTNIIFNIFRKDHNTYPHLTFKHRTFLPSVTSKNLTTFISFLKFGKLLDPTTVSSTI